MAVCIRGEVCAKRSSTCPPRRAHLAGNGRGAIADHGRLQPRAPLRRYAFENVNRLAVALHSPFRNMKELGQSEPDFTFSGKVCMDLSMASGNGAR